MTTTVPASTAAAEPAPPATAEPGLSPAQRRSKALRRFALSITVLNIVGLAWLGFEQAFITPFVAVGVAYAVELALETADAAAHGRRPRYLGSFGEVLDFMLPAHITGLACSMLLYANDRLWPVAFAAAVGIGSKYVVRARVRGKSQHVLNPSNTGIVAALLLFPWVGIAPPYQFTEYPPGALRWIIPLIVLVAGTMLNAKLTKKMPLLYGWIAGFVLQALIRSAVTDVWLVGALLPMTGVAFILYTNYMISDPGTTPFAPRRQFAFGLGIAAAYGVLMVMHVSFGFFFALGIVCLLRWVALVSLPVTRPLLDRVRNRTAAPAARTAAPGEAS
ncbi:enediyne biosynthesis protein UnbU [Streptomyces sp. TRM64462]|uniref:enediyne biosynthesis protein UnbU n=1 Tax=Streptomyces sp. TRM64462 TaxID=2741726 RepID=UPI0015866A7F|nr:enediyne biosynthesis protein UnbU [Streptomyces sp. TRM64462]